MFEHEKDNLVKAAFDEAIRHPDENVARAVLARVGAGDESIAKSITVATGLVGFDLQAPAKNLYPVLTPLRNVTPRVKGETGVATNWRVVSAIHGSGFSNTPWVPEGSRAGKMSYTTNTLSANYATLGEEDDITFEAQSAGRDFEDLLATMGMRLLDQTALKEEAAILLGNASVSLATPSTPSLSASGSGATLPSSSSDTYSVYVVALTAEGYWNSNVSATGGVATSISITPAGGTDTAFTVNGGSSNISAAGTQAVTLGQTLFASVAPVNGAVAYAWYVGLTANTTAAKLQAITTINSASFSAPLISTGQAASAITGNSSVNSGGFNGYLATAFSGTGAYVNTLATGTAGTGTTLTASGRGSVSEIDALLVDRWNNYQLSVDTLYVNAQEAKTITDKALSTGSGSLLNYFQSPKDGEYKLVAGGTIEYYYNPYAVDGGTKIPVKIHPKVPAGTIFAHSNRLPAHYKSNHVPNVAELKVRDEYYQILWPLVSRKRASGVYVSEVLAVYAPFALGIINNIAHD